MLSALVSVEALTVEQLCVETLDTRFGNSLKWKMI